MKNSLFALLLLASSNAEAAQEWYQCKTSADCVIVQDSYCRLMESVNKDSLSAWEEADNKPVQPGKTCSSLPYPAKMEEYQAECVQSSCHAVRTKPWPITN